MIAAVQSLCKTLLWRQKKKKKNAWKIIRNLLYVKIRVFSSYT